MQQYPVCLINLHMKSGEIFKFNNNNLIHIHMYNRGWSGSEDRSYEIGLSHHLLGVDPTKLNIISWKWPNESIQTVRVEDIESICIKELGK